MVVLLFALVSAVVIARYWISSDSGRDFVVSQIDGRDVAGYGRLSVRRFEGDPLSAFAVGSLEIRDSAGVWLTAENINLSWSPFALLSRTVDIDDLSISGVNVLRRPVRADRPDTDSDPWEIRLGKATIDRMFIAEGVAGPESASRISARFLNERNGSIDAQLQISPLEGAGDRIEARILRDRKSAFDVIIDGTAPAGGVFAHLLRLPEGASAVVTATAAGDLEDGRGEARLTVDGNDKVFFSGKIEKNALDANIRFDAAALPVSENLAAFLGPRAEVDITALFEKSTVSFTAAGRVAAGTMNLAGQSRSDRFELSKPAQVSANLTSLAPFWKAPRIIVLDGTLQKKEAGYLYSGQTRLELKADSGFPFESVSGPVTASLEAGRVPFTGDVTVTRAFASNPAIASVIGEDVRLSGNGVYDIDSRRVLIDAVEVTHRTGSAQLLGEAAFSDSTLNVSGRITQSLDALPGGFGGTASGFAQAKGHIRDFELGLNLNLAGLTTSINQIKPLVEGRGTLRGMLQIKPDSGDIRRLDVRLPGVEGQMTGRLYGAQSPDLRLTLQQLQPLDVSGNQIDLASVTAHLTRRSGGMLLIARSAGGSAVVSGRMVSNLLANAELLIRDGDISGPVNLSGRSDGQASSASFELDRSGTTTRFNGIRGKLGSIEFTGSAVLADGGEIEADLDVQGETFEFAGIRFGTLKLKGTGGRAGDRPFAIGAEFEARDVQVTSRLVIDEVIGTIRTTAEGYRFEGRLVDKLPRADSDVLFSGLVALGDGSPSGSLSLSGALLGIAVATREDIIWSLGPAPTLNADISLLGGHLQARLRPGNETTSSSLTLENLSTAPVLAALGYPAIDAVVSGRSNGRLYGENPEGVVELSATSAVSGLTTEIGFNLTGRLDRRAFTWTAQSTYGPDLKANAAGRLPVLASSGRLVRIDENRPIEALADVNGDLKSLRLLALAYGHDIGGTLQSRTEVSGTIGTPAIKSSANITNGSYEYGATGLSLKNLDLVAGYENEVLTLTGTGAGTSGGTLTLNGRLAEKESGVDVGLNRILVYDRLGDHARISGDAKLTEGARDRVLSGALTINDARFNINNFSDTSIRTLNVRWTTDDPNSARETVLNKPIRLQLKLSAARGVFVHGRGLDSDWGVNLDVSGTPDSVLLNGRATLVRGTLELARRPFVFDSGLINFDGPLESARLAISATRDLDGFSVRTDVGGSPSRPTIELSSTPSLPEDEILSRMLFGRSSIDLTALEAAELASSIARLAGRETGIDPIGAIQSGLGVDRLRFGVDNTGNAELGVGQYLAPDVYLEVTTQGAAGNSVEVEWQPRPQVSVSSETSSTGESRVSVRWKKDY
jgi:translocation and assembly module TamB